MIVDINQLVTVSSAAKKCHLSRRYLYDCINKGTCPDTVSIDGIMFFREAEIMLWNKNRLLKRKMKR